MFFRRTALAAGIVTLATAVLVTTAGAARGGSPTTPTNLRITATTETSVSLAWNASTGNNFWYCVQRQGSGCIRVDPPRTTMTWPGLAPNTTHTFSVYAVDSRGHRSGNSNSVSYTTPPDTEPPAPAPSLTLTYLRPTRIGVSWTASVDNTSQVWYSLYVNGSAFFWDEIGSRSRLLFDLIPETTYELKITARDRYFNTVESNVLSVATPATTDTEPPTAPTNLTFQLIEKEIWADWDGSTDNVDPAEEILYDFYLNGELTHDGGFGTSGIAYCRASGPTVVVVKAVDSSGNISEPSNELLVDCP
jgi:chitodextrinase